MKAITIRQPWASLIIHGIKDIENRTWACPKKYIGQRVLIHASAKPILKGSCISHYLTEEQYKSVAFATPPEKQLDICFLEHYSPAIIGSVQIVDCVINHPSIWAEKSMESKCPNCGREIKKHFNEDYFFCEHCDRKCIKGSHYEKHIYNWVLANPVLFKEPIQAKGRLSFWEIELTEEQINNL